MPSTATTSNRLEKQATGENTNTWGSKLNATAFDLIDTALDGRTAFTLSGSKTLSSTNFAADEARARFLDITSGTGGTVTIPAVPKWYLVRNATSGNVIFTTGGATTATVPAGTIQFVICDAAKVYVDTTATAAAASAAAAAASAASVNDASLVHLTGSETITGVKTFSNGLIINGQTLDGLSAIGVTIAEAANAAAVKTALALTVGTDVQAFNNNLTALAGLTFTGSAFKVVRVNSAGTGLELALSSTNDTMASDVAVTATSAAQHAATFSSTVGTLYRVTLRGLYKSTSTSTALRINLAGAFTVFASGDATIWHSTTANTQVPIAIESANLTAAITGTNAAVSATLYPFKVEMLVRVTGGTPSVSITYTNTAGTGTITVLAGTTLAVQQLT